MHMLTDFKKKRSCARGDGWIEKSRAYELTDDQKKFVRDELMDGSEKSCIRGDERTENSCVRADGWDRKIHAY